MKKSVVYFLSVILAVFVLSSCKDDASSPSSGNNGNSNVPESEFPTTAKGGDPRGTYTPNTPAIVLKYNPSSEDLVLTTTFTKNTGSGSITLQGASATSGTYTLNNMSLDIQGKLKLTRNGQVLGEQPFFPGDVLDSTKPTGTWKVENGKLIFENEDEGSSYTITSKGLFFVSDLDFESLGTGTMSMCFRKK